MNAGSFIAGLYFGGMVWGIIICGVLEFEKWRYRRYLARQPKPKQYPYRDGVQ